MNEAQTTTVTIRSVFEDDTELAQRNCKRKRDDSSTLACLLHAITEQQDTCAEETAPSCKRQKLQTVNVTDPTLSLHEKVVEEKGTAPTGRPWLQQKRLQRLLNCLRMNAVTSVVWRSRHTRLSGRPALSRPEALQRVPTRDELVQRTEWTQGCPYCGHALEQRNKAFYKASMDRVDTSCNYYVHPKTRVPNFVLCCQPCNLMRNDTDIHTFQHMLLTFSQSDPCYVPTEQDRQRARQTLAQYAHGIKQLPQSRLCRFTCMLNALYQDTVRWSRTPLRERYDMSADTFKQMFIQQGGFHRGTNIPLLLDAQALPRDLLIPSIDHIDPQGNSSIVNLQLVCYGFNTMKNKFSMRDALAHMDWLRSQRLFLASRCFLRGQQG